MHTKDLFGVRRETVTREINDMLRELDLVSSHGLRYSAITEVADSAGILMASQFVGHKSISTTERYVMSLLGEEERKRIRDIRGLGVKRN